MRAERPETSMTPPTGLWPDGWYVYVNGGVRGPYSAEDAFGANPGSPIGQPDRMISRLGWAQWYPVRDLAELYSVTNQIGHQRINELERLTSEVRRQLEALREARETPHVTTPSESPIAVAGPAPVVAPPQMKIKSRDVGPKTEPAREQPTVATSKPVDTPKPVVKSVAKPVVSSATPARQATPQPTPQPTPHPAPKQAPKQAQETEATWNWRDDYHFCKGRLRLGDIRNPWIESFVMFPVTFGLVWLGAFARLSREIAWHLGEHPARNPLRGTWKAAVPGLHCAAAYGLASRLRLMEAKNNAAETSPALAAFLSLIPPVGLAYLQTRANTHWMTHVMHAKQR